MKCQSLFAGKNKKIGFDILCKLSPEETICMKCESLLAGENKTYLQFVVY